MTSEITTCNHLVKLNLLDLDIGKLDCSFKINNMIVYTENDTLFIVIEDIPIRSFEGLSGSSVKHRPQVIKILNILSFFTGSTITIYDIFSQTTSKNEYSEKFINIKNNYIVHDEVDLTPALENFKKRYEKKEFVINSLLNLWAKATYLLTIDDFRVLLLDEATLNYIQIIEILSDDTKLEYEKIINKKAEELVTRYYNEILFDEHIITSEIQSNFKNIKKELNGVGVSFKTKVKYFCKKMGLLDDKISNLIEKIVDIRNNIAHGKIVDYDIMEYPWSPFMNKVEKNRNIAKIIEVFSRICIGRYIHINIFDEEWNDIKKYYIPESDRIIKSFLKGELVKKREEILFGRDSSYNIKFNNIFEYYVNNKKSTFEEVENGIGTEFLKIDLEGELIDYFEIAVILADSTNENISTHSKKIIKKCLENQEYYWGNYKDVIYYVEARKKKVVWFIEYLNKK